MFVLQKNKNMKLKIFILFVKKMNVKQKVIFIMLGMYSRHTVYVVSSWFVVFMSVHYNSKDKY